MSADSTEGAPARPPLAPFDAGAMAAQRRQSCEAFLAARGTSLPRLAGLVGEQMGDLRHVLLTSSPVHGLATATSDIDTISVVEGGALGDRTATQIFDGPNHCETIPFTVGEVAAELRRLREAAALPAAAAVARHRGWDKGGPIGRKYLERLVNGVAVDGTSPFLGALPALAVLWRAASFGRAAAMADCGRLSVAAGEHGGALGYAANALLFAMDAFLSHHGQVYSNKKWFLLRFRGFLARGSGGAGARGPAQALDALWDEVEGALGRAPEAADADDMVRRLGDGVAALGDHLGLPFACCGGWAAAPGLRTLDFLPGAQAQVGGGRLALGGPSRLSPEDAAAPFSSAGQLPDAAVARARLRAARAGFLVPSFGD